MLKAGDISAILTMIELLRGENVRKGFIAPAEFKALAEAGMPGYRLTIGAAQPFETSGVRD
jgi:hypothetical protein